VGGGRGNGGLSSRAVEYKYSRVFGGWAEGWAQGRVDGWAEGEGKGGV
jgi:hypothetical protein